MATLVLSTVGRVLGGPIGGAIGAIAGQFVDRELIFKPKGREGPRLTELAVQTSAYGTPIQKVFGTMRIAGCVIWSTELIESRSTSRSGKGQPATANYSYAVSFAVALSGREIRGVGRIWADGKLLRGRGGDFKSATGFRLHPGSEAQAVDPLIAAAENGLAPAHRGIAYAVFENFQLADYGNRIPSLSFEVIGDAGPVAAGAIAAEIGAGLIDGAEATLPVPGFSAHGNSMRAVIEMLAAASGASFAPAGAGLRMASAGAAGVTLADGGVAAGERGGARGTRTLAAIESVPRRVAVAYYDPARDYQTGLQAAQRPGAGRRDERIELPAAFDADTAKTIALNMLARAEAGRERRTLRLGWGELAIAPGACVAIAGTPGVWRVAGWSLEAMVLSLDCVRLAVGSAPAAASAGRMLPAPDLIAGTTICHAFEIPALGDAILNSPRITIAAAGTGAGWRGAALLYSTDDGARWNAGGATAAPATLGLIVTAPGVGGAALFDRVSSFEVDLAHEGMTLTGADDAALDAGVNFALAGDELLQFGVAAQIAPRRWRLSRLLRGRRGTEAAAGQQAAGDRFVLIEADAAVAIDVPLSSLGTTVRVLASGIGDTAGPVSAAAAMRGASVLPPAPVHLRAAYLAGGDVAIGWVRRSRGGWRWIDGADAPLGEEREAYRVTIRPAAAPERRIEVAAPGFVLPAADRAGGPVVIDVRQAGSHGESRAARISLSAL